MLWLPKVVYMCIFKFSLYNMSIKPFRKACLVLSVSPLINLKKAVVVDTAPLTGPHTEREPESTPAGQSSPSL